MISNGLGRLRSFGGPSGSQRSSGLFSWPGMALGPTNGFAASNFALPHGVKGGRVRLDTAFIPGTPGTSPSGYCIQTPERSCDKAGDAGCAVSCGCVVPGGLFDWAGAVRARIVSAPANTSDFKNRIIKTFRRELPLTPERWSSVPFTRKKSRGFTGPSLSSFSSPGFAAARARKIFDLSFAGNYTPCSRQTVCPQFARFTGCGKTPKLVVIPSEAMNLFYSSRSQNEERFLASLRMTI